MRKKFEINELIKIEDQQVSLSAKGEAIIFSGDFMNSSQSFIDYNELKINNQKISTLENPLVQIIKENIDEIILDIIEKKSRI
jgi:hypothetical protein